MSYQYDVFISYNRFWQKWVENIFQPLFEFWLTAELGRSANVFFDFEQEKDNLWPKRLGEGIASSALIVPLWSRNYFSSCWCTHELGHMLQRQDILDKDKSLHTPQVIVPLIIHDGEHFPEGVDLTNALNIAELTNVITKENGATHEKLSAALQNWMPNVAKRVENAPPAIQNGLILLPKLLLNSIMKHQSKPHCQGSYNGSHSYILFLQRWRGPNHGACKYCHFIGVKRQQSTTG